MQIINVLGIWIATARININNKTHYLYRSAKNKQTVMNNMFSLIAECK